MKKNLLSTGNVGTCATDKKGNVIYPIMFEKIHKNTFVGFSTFDGGKHLKSNAYLQCRGIMLGFIRSSPEEIERCKSIGMDFEIMIGWMLFTGLFREVINNKDEYYQLVKKFVNIYGKPIEQDLILYRTTNDLLGETANSLGCFWSSSMNMAMSYYSDMVIAMKLNKGTRVYQLTQEKALKFCGNSHVCTAYNRKGLKFEDEYWVDMSSFFGDSMNAEMNRRLANVSPVGVARLMAA